MPDRVAAFVQGRSSIGRIGLTVQNAGFVDPGFTGHITLELVNESPVTIYLKPGYPVAQLVFFDVSPVNDPYHGKYNGQEEATGSRMFMDKQKYPGL
jgi:dCTP deaminase